MKSPIYSVFFCLLTWNRSRRRCAHPGPHRTPHQDQLNENSRPFPVFINIEIQVTNWKPIHKNELQTGSPTTTTKANPRWWFPKNCGDANPNGPYSRTLNEVILPEGMNGAADNEIGEVFYITWRGEDFPLKKITMQIAPREAVNQAEFSFLFTNDTKPVEVDANAPAMETTTQSENFDVPPF